MVFFRLGVKFRDLAELQGSIRTARAPDPGATTHRAPHRAASVKHKTGNRN
jgi:hypothetical protein